MATYSHSTTTKAAPERVWRLWSDPATWPSWNPDVLSVDIAGPFRSGAAGTMQTKAGGRHSITLESVEPGRSFLLVSTAIPGTRFAFRCEVVPDGVGSTISQSVTMRGPLGGLAGAMMGKRVAEGFGPILAGLRDAAEAADR